MTTHVYPITPPEGCPSYVVDSVQKHCNYAFNQAFNGVSTNLLDRAYAQAMSNELQAMRSAYDEKTTTSEWWLKWGHRTVTRAFDDAASLGHFRDALANPDVSHVTSGHPCSPNVYHVYVRDPKSPSGCHLIGSACRDLPGVEIILAGRRTCQGGQRWEMANRAALRGF